MSDKRPCRQFIVQPPLVRWLLATTPSTCCPSQPSSAQLATPFLLEVASITPPAYALPPAASSPAPAPCMPRTRLTALVLLGAAGIKYDPIAPLDGRRQCQPDPSAWPHGLNPAQQHTAVAGRAATDDRLVRRAGEEAGGEAVMLLVLAAGEDLHRRGVFCF